MGPRAMLIPIRGGRVTSGLSFYDRSEGSNSGWDMKLEPDVGKVVVHCLSIIRIVAARYPNERIGLGGGAVNTGEGGDSGKGIWGGDEDHGDSGDAGGEDIASSLATSEFRTMWFRTGE
ncbi:hypothetical protein Tco_1058126 [Tanacetum coccineum]|uniref:Uncharacterized protein n=1 Tax=Tanacetum coccineum TaxID=301880 RepID=A0ABQ5H7I0_9ASTR